MYMYNVYFTKHDKLNIFKLFFFVYFSFEMLFLTIEL